MSALALQITIARPCETVRITFLVYTVSTLHLYICEFPF
jgi:hypothetical protein